jgi:hypothetical protein
MADRTVYKQDPQTLLATYSDLGYGSLEDPRGTIYQWLVLNTDDFYYRIRARNNESTGTDSYTKGAWFTLVDETQITVAGSHAIAIPALADELVLEVKESESGTVRISGRVLIVTPDDSTALGIYTGYLNT